MRPVIALFDRLWQSAIEHRGKIDRLGIQQERLIVGGMPSFPLLGQIRQFPDQAGLDLFFDQLVLKVVGDFVKVHDVGVVDVFVGQSRTRDAKAILLRPFEVGAEPLEPEVPDAQRRLEMKN